MLIFMDLNVLILCAILLDILCLLLRASSMFLLIIVPLQYEYWGLVVVSIQIYHR